MDDTTDPLADEALPRARLALLLEQFSRLDDERESWRVMYPLSEVLLLLTCATIASCDDFDEIAAWGRHHLEFLRRFALFHFGIPCERWLRTLVNRVDPILFGRCFEDWIKALWPGRHDLIAIDGKTGLFQVLCDQPEVGVSFGKQPGKGPVSTRRGMAI